LIVPLRLPLTPGLGADPAPPALYPRRIGWVVGLF
jgi:hypothetical protein